MEKFQCLNELNLRDNTKNWNWTLSFTNDTANVSIFTNQSVGTLTVGATCQRMLSNSEEGDLGT
jgi:hypothetical protein